ncbi:MAG: EpsI family protein [candidate division KSB1 bacterium]|nr:EpsI family protein [candidate division KSB1 bacterium]
MYWFIVLLFLITGRYVYVLRYIQMPINELPNLENVSSHFSSWQMAQKHVLKPGTQEILKATQSIWRSYANAQGYTINLFIAYFHDQKYGSQIHSPKHCLPGGGWKIIQKENYFLDIITTKPRSMMVNKMVISDKRRKELVIYWFWTRSGIITSEYRLKFDLAKNALFRQPTDAALVRINLPIIDNEDDSQALRLATQFISEIFPNIQSVLPFDE